MIENLEINGLKLIKPKKHADARGFFSEVFNSRTWSEAGLNYNFVQDNHSLSRDVGTLRGLHFQLPPFAQDKLIRVVRGSILDIAVDIRRSSPTFGKYVAIELSYDNWNQLFIPIGFAHGFLTLETNTEVLYKVTNLYSPAHDRGIVWDDPELAIEWRIARRDITLSEKDSMLPLLSEIEELFP